MSSIYVQEPPTSGKILFKTTVGDLDIELWSKETPKACRNFVQLCLEGYYNGTIFHRVVKGFIVQGGDPTGTGTGGESIYGAPFKDEIHSRLRFNRRGLVAMANAGKDDNGSQFFFTMGATPELQGKHTIFGKVSGDTVYNMLKLEDALVDQDDRPQYPQKILKTEVLNNPFHDIIPRVLPKSEKTKTETEKRKSKTKGVKNYKLLSFGEEAEEDEEEAAEASKAFAGRSKSTHDVLDDPKLSSLPAIESQDSKLDGISDDDSSSSVDLEKTREQVERVKNKLTKLDAEVDKKKLKLEENDNDDEPFEEYDFHKERREERKKKAEEIRKEIRDLKKNYKIDKDKREKEAKIEENRVAREDNTIKNYRNEVAVYQAKKKELPKKGASREEFTLQLLSKFKNKLQSVKEKHKDSDEEDEKETKEGSDEEDTEWLAHKLKFQSTQPELAKDANTKNDDWFEISDPRNAINKRRREASKELLQKLEKRYRE
ncbi:spliceosome-associated protein CWC27 homolog [Lycorma delicatula]|uniref:spliceosome-associated protein CWC27 homolog n=1 Tax=Lycorma delicatula TaxID=130591 RepID=UPI003F50F3D4